MTALSVCPALEEMSRQLQHQRQQLEQHLARDLAMDGEGLCACGSGSQPQSFWAAVGRCSGSTPPGDCCIHHPAACKSLELPLGAYNSACFIMCVLVLADGVRLQPSMYVCVLAFRLFLAYRRVPSLMLKIV